jgi:alpha,alpha-trehalase
VALILDRSFGGSLTLSDGRTEISSEWRRRARHRKEKMTELLWEDDAGMFLDYDMKSQRRHPYLSATAFYPLWAGLATPRQAQSIVDNALPHLELSGGLVASAKASRGELSPKRPERQWDYPNGWPPHQILAWEGLRRYGFMKAADRLTYRWLYTIAKNARDFSGTVPEKFDVETGSHPVFSQYRNVDTKFSYITREGFGWMNTSFQVGRQTLPKKLLENLRAGKSTEEALSLAE